MSFACFALLAVRCGWEGEGCRKNPGLELGRLGYHVRAQQWIQPDFVIVRQSSLRQVRWRRQPEVIAALRCGQQPKRHPGRSAYE